MLLESILTDLDFNVFNQMPNPANRWLATVTYNHHDHRLPFSSVLLAPAYFVAQLTTFFVGGEKVIETKYLAYIFLNTIVLFHILKMISVSNKSYFKSLFLVLISSIGLHYFVFNPGEFALASVGLTTQIFTYLFLKEREDQDQEINFKADFVYLYIPILLFTLIRPDSFVWMPIIIGHSLLYQRTKNMLQLTAAYLFTWLILGTTLYIQYAGTNVLSPIVQFKKFNIVALLFGETGLFLMQPIFLVCLIGIITGLKSSLKKEQRASLFCLSIILLKLSLMSLMSSHLMDTLIGRHYLAELPLYSYGLYLFYKKYKKTAISLTALSFLVSAYFNMLGIFNWLTADKVLYSGPKTLEFFMKTGDYLQTVKSFYHYRFGLIDYATAGTFFKVSLISSLLLFFLFKLSSIRNYLLLSLVLVVSFFSANLLNNQKNVAILKENGVFAKTVIGKGPLLHYDEVIDYLHMVENHTERYQSHNWKRLKKIKKAYLKKAIDNVVADPIGFKRDLENNIIRQSFWQKM